MRFLLSCLIFAAAANAATISTTLTMTNASATLSGANIVLTGPVTLANIGSGTFSATGSLTNITGLNANAPFTITLSTGDKLTGTLTVPATLFVSATNSATASATVTGGTGAYAGATGSFPSLTGSSTGTVSSGLSVNLSGAGSITPGGGGSTAATPIITQVSDAASYSNTIAPGSMFVIIGSNLSPSGVTYLGFPLPTSASGVSVTFTASSGGAAINPYLVYLYNQNGVNQLAGILPSSAAPGSYNVTVTSGGATSAPSAISVAASHPRLFTQNSAGTGLAVVQNYISASEVDVNRFTTDTVNGSYISPAHPGQTLIAWVT
ncbi:MAG: hypothetical protein JO022_11450, partial [Acidobacteriaceae bacterium]|nr:hypothetical protein [Acidobacteriaceae bacterium]